MNMTDYAETRRTFRLDVPEDYEFTRDVVDAWAARAARQGRAGVGRPGRGEPAGRTRSRTSSRAANRVANGLQALGVQPGERAFVMPPGSRPGTSSCAACSRSA